MKRLASILVCLLLPAVAAATDQDTQPDRSSRALDHSSTATILNPGAGETELLGADSLAATSGSGTAEIGCGAVAGASLVFALTGVGAPVAITLAALGAACTLLA